MTKEIEVWVGIPKFEGLYEISNIGRVRSLPRKTKTGILGGKILSPAKERNGYSRITLSSNGKAFRYLLHRLVLISFIGECPDFCECLHADGDRSNCKLKNLSWGTRSENAFDRVKHGTQVNNRGEKHGMTKLTDHDAKEIYELRKIGVSINEVAIKFSTSIATVSRISNGHGWKHISRNIK